MTCPSIRSLEAVVAGRADDKTRRHVDECETCRRDIDAMRQHISLFDRLQSADLDDDQTPPPAGPMTIEGYELLEEIHRGAQGVVHRAVQTATRRDVALKILLAGAFATPRQKRRFERETEVVASLRHPSIVTVFDSGISAGGAAFLVMEFIDGVPLDEFVRARRDAGQWTVRDALALAEDITAGVAYAHQHAVLHRDLKPSNILIDDQGRPHIVDFGLARRMDLASHVTLEGAFVGTLAYASPEQAAAGDIDARSDVYALGAILHEMLTGRTPTPIDGTFGEVLAAIQKAEPASIRAESGWAGRIDDDVDAIVARALANDPERRYQTAEAMRQDIARYLRGEPIDARRDSTVYVLRKTLSRHRVPVGIASLFVVLLVAFSIAMSLAYRESRLEADKANTIRLFLEDTLASVDPSRPGHVVTMREALDEAVHWVSLALSGQPRIEASLRTTIGNSYRALGELDRAEQQLDLAIEIRRRHPDKAELAQSLSALALLRLEQDRPQEALDLLDQVLTLRRSALGPRHPSIVYTMSNLARTKQALGRLDDAEQDLRQAIDLARHNRAGGQDVAICTFRLAQLRADRDDLPSAIALYQEALATQRSALASDHPDIGRTLMALGRAQLELGNPQAAAQTFQQAAEQRRLSLTDTDWRVAVAQAARAQSLVLAGAHEDALVTLPAAIDALLDALPPDDPRLTDAVAAAVQACEALDRPDDADRYRAMID